MWDWATTDVLFYLMTLWIYICQVLLTYYQKDPAVFFMQQDAKFT